MFLLTVGEQHAAAGTALRPCHFTLARMHYLHTAESSGRAKALIQWKYDPADSSAKCNWL
jgi:hypothetical protein